MAHYVIFCLFEDLDIPPPSSDAKQSAATSAYIQILNPGATSRTEVTGLASFANIDDVTQRYSDIKRHLRATREKEYAEEGLNAKFKDRVLQDLLISTGGLTLVYDDTANSVLGVGEKQTGENFVGRYLMILREKFRKQRESEREVEVNLQDISIVLDDSIIRWWIAMRVGDMCRVILTVKEYLYSKAEITQHLTADFATTVLDTVYQPCSQLFGSVGLITTEAPQEFVGIVRRCRGFETVGDKVVEVIWKHIAVMIYALIKHCKIHKISNMRAVLGQIGTLLSRRSLCKEIVADNEDSCIISALLNLLTGIVEFNNLLGNDSKITEDDVKLAASIILDANISGEIILPGPVSGDWPGEDLDLHDPTQAEAEWRFPGHSDDESSGGDYGDMSSSGSSGGSGRSGGSGYAPIDKIVPLLLEISNDCDAQAIAQSIDTTVDFIKAYPDTSESVKQNRINFFATLR